MVINFGLRMEKMYFGGGTWGVCDANQDATRLPKFSLQLELNVTYQCRSNQNLARDHESPSRFFQHYCVKNGARPVSIEVSSHRRIIQILTCAK